MFRVPERLRIKKGIYGSDRSYGCNGAFILTYEKDGQAIELHCLASNGANWEHVSVTCANVEPKRCPMWLEMCYVKSVFWSKHDPVVQYHPPENSYVNFHEYCLHLWRPMVEQLPLPPTILVGPKKKV